MSPSCTWSLPGRLVHPITYCPLCISWEKETRHSTSSLFCKLSQLTRSRYAKFELVQMCLAWLWLLCSDFSSCSPREWTTYTSQAWAGSGSLGVQSKRSNITCSRAWAALVGLQVIILTIYMFPFLFFSPFLNSSFSFLLNTFLQYLCYIVDLLYSFSCPSRKTKQTSHMYVWFISCLGTLSSCMILAIKVFILFMAE